MSRSPERAPSTSLAPLIARIATRHGDELAEEATGRTIATLRSASEKTELVVPMDVMRLAIESIVRVAFDNVLAERIAQIVAAHLGAVASSEVYSSGKTGAHIPGKSRRWMVRNLRRMRGARKVGRDWQIARLDYERWMTDQDVQECRSAIAKAPPTDAREIALKALAKAGLRPTQKD